jgi:hypothetical protein
MPKVGLVDAPQSTEPRQRDPTIRRPLPSLELVGAEMNAYEFTLVLSGVAEITRDMADALYTATGGDIEFNMRNDVAYIEFERDADTLHDAVRSAIAQVEGAGVGVRVVRVESDAANTIAKINADLLGVGLRE